MGAEFRILGPLEVLENGTPLELGGQKQRALLAMLLLHANEVVSTDRLIEALWEDSPPERAQKALQVHVSQLRKLLGKDRLQTRAPGYELRVRDEELDRTRFERLIEEGKPREALALWRGQPVADFSYSRFAQAEIGRLQELRLAAIEDRMDGDLAGGRHAALAGELEALVRDHPLRERLRGQLMLALYRAGRQAEALEAYQDARRALTEELGIEPGRELRDLQHAILRQDPSLDPAAQVGAADSAPDSARSVFVGREDELTQLTAALDDAFAGRGGLVLLVGEPGIGKSRLTDELIRRARSRGAVVVVGRCWEVGGAPAYWPWVQSLRSYVRATPADQLREVLGRAAPELAQLLPELRELYPDIPGSVQVDAERARFRLFEAVSTVLGNAGRSRPLVLALDDLHAADEPSLLLLRFLARELADSRLLVVGAYRNVDPIPTDPLTETLTELVREPITRSIVLEGLTADDVRRFVELSTGESPSDDLVSAIHEETEGNPLFVGEIVRLLASEGGLDPDMAPRITIPQSVRAVIARRLRNLSEDSNQVLALASVLGREFSLGVLARAADISEDELLDILDEAILERVLTDVPGTPTELRFTHVLVRDTLYEGLTTARRVRLHRQALEALEELYGENSSEVLAELAYHAIAGSDFERGVRYAKSAGDRALELLAYEEAARLYETGLEALDLAVPPDDHMRCELLLARGDAQARAGEIPESRSTFLQASSAARRSGAADQLARAALGYGGRLVWGREAGDTTVEDLLEDALATLGENDSVLRARVLARLAVALRDEHSPERRESLSKEAVQMARRMEDAETLAFTLVGSVPAIYGPDNIEERLEIADEIIRLAADINDRERAAEGRFHLLCALLELGDIPRASEALEALGRLANELHQPSLLWLVAEASANLALLQGRFEDAAELIPQVRRHGERAHPEGQRSFRLQTLTLHRERGSVDEDEVESFALESPRPTSRCVLAHTYATLGREESARREFEALAGSAFEPVPRDSEWLFAMSLLADVCAFLKDRRAATLYELILPYGARNALSPTELSNGAVSRSLGLLASVMSRWDEAEFHFDEALKMNERMGARPWLARTQEDYARMLVARGGPGDDERARELLDQALATYRELGMEGSLRSAQALAAA